jgi:hypothetical protein
MQTRLEIAAGFFSLVQGGVFFTEALLQKSALALELGNPLLVCL